MKSLCLYLAFTMGSLWVKDGVSCPKVASPVVLMSFLIMAGVLAVPRMPSLLNTNFWIALNNTAEQPPFVYPIVTKFIAYIQYSNPTDFAFIKQKNTNDIW